MITADQLVLHALGDYIFQSDWMAKNKTKAHLPAFVHAFLYSVLFVTQVPSVTAWLVIFGTHFLIDRYRLARYVVWLKNCAGPHLPWHDCDGTGYPKGDPAWLAVWLLIIADNILHVLINGMAIRYF